MLEMMFQGVWYANTQTQIHKYGLYTNIVNDEMSVNPMKCYIFGKPLMQGCRIWYLELLTMQIQNTNTQIQCIWKYPNLQLYVLQMGAWPYPSWLVSYIERSILIPEWTTLQNEQPNQPHNFTYDTSGVRTPSLISLYPVLSKNIALHRVYWHFIIYCICI